MPVIPNENVIPKVSVCNKYAIEVEPILPSQRNNRNVQQGYLNRLKDTLDTLRDIVKEARSNITSDNSLEYACVYTKTSQELLENLIASCLNTVNKRDRYNASTHAKRNKNVTFVELLETWPNNTSTQVVQIVLWYLDSGCSKHMTRDRSRLRNFVKKFIGTVRFGNDHFRAIIVAFRKHTCFVKDLDGVDLIKGTCGSNLYTIYVEDMMRSSPIFLLSKASKNKYWLWRRRLNRLNFGTINDLARKDLVRGLPRFKFEKDHLCSACQLGKSKKYAHKPKTINTIMEVLHTLHMDLCGPIRVQSINGKKYILVIVDDYSSVGISHQKSVRRPPQQNGVVEIRNRTLVEDARRMLIFSKALTEDLGKLQAKADIGFFVGYTPDHKGYRIYNKRTQQIMETIYVTFDELTRQTAPDHISLGPTPNLLTPGPISLELMMSSATAIPYVPPTNKELEMLFQPMFDEYFDTIPVNQHHASFSIEEDAPSTSISSSLVQRSPSVHQGVVVDHTLAVNPFAPVDDVPFINIFAPNLSSEATSSWEVSPANHIQSILPHKHLRKLTNSHPIDNIIGNPSRSVSTRKQLATDALWCFYNFVLSKVEPKNFKYVVIEDCWFEAIKEKNP
nr:hypothetical protein [Tanacetum cinerariifolium]